jgi:hypothetical protein
VGTGGITAPGNRRNYSTCHVAEIQCLAAGGITVRGNRRNYSAWQQAELQHLPRCGITVPGNGRNYSAWQQAELQCLATGGITAPGYRRNYSAWEEAELQRLATGGITVPGKRRNYSAWQHSELQRLATGRDSKFWSRRWLGFFPSPARPIWLWAPADSIRDSAGELWVTMPGSHSVKAVTSSTCVSPPGIERSDCEAHSSSSLRVPVSEFGYLTMLSVAQMYREPAPYVARCVHTIQY